tara:strand:- start:2375 stop:2770 length:396 start_codon:yes stop_codon:yes gene_type:complete
MREAENNNSNLRVGITYLETGIPQTIMRRGFEEGAGRPRIVPKNIQDPNELPKLLNKRLKDFSILEKKAYNRIASRNTYIKEKVEFKEGITADKYKKNLNKKVKDFTKVEKREYNRLSKIENRMKKKYSSV